MVSSHTPPKPQGTTGQTMCVAKCCARQTCTHQIEASWGAEKTTPPPQLHAVCATGAALPDWLATGAATGLGMTAGT
jgi:hypothetical protein